MQKKKKKREQNNSLQKAKKQMAVNFIDIYLDFNTKLILHETFLKLQGPMIPLSENTLKQENEAATQLIRIYEKMSSQW